MNRLTQITNLFTVGFCALLISACQSKPEVHSDNILAFGTFIEVTLVGLKHEQAEVVMDKINTELKFYHYAFHPFQAGPTGRVNSLLAATGEFTANPALIPLVKQSILYNKQSKGLFNPAIGQLIKLWGYHEEIPSEGPAPQDDEIQAIVKLNPSMQTITVHGVRMSNTNPAVKLDFGGIAKGYALDTILTHIQEMGVQNAIINTGGDLKVIGQGTNGPWKIGIRDPRGDGVIASLHANDGEAVFTSGDYERFFIEAGKRYHHILDPRTGYPAQNAQSVTVVHENGALADAAATALFIAGSEQWLDIAKNMQIKQALLVDRNGKIYVTRSLHQRLKFEKAGLDIKIVDDPI